MIVPVSIIRHAILVAEDGRIRDAVLSNWVRNGRYLEAGLAYQDHEYFKDSGAKVNSLLRTVSFFTCKIIIYAP